MQLIAEFVICFCIAYLCMVLFRIIQNAINTSRFLVAMPKCVNRTIMFIGDFLEDLMNTTVYPEYEIDEFIEFIKSEPDETKKPPLEICKLATWVMVENDYEQEIIITAWIDNIADWIFNMLYHDILNEVFDLSTGRAKYIEPYQYIATRLLGDKKDAYLEHVREEYSYLILYLRYAHATGENLKKIRQVNVTKYESCHRTIMNDKQSFTMKYRKMLDEHYAKFLDSFRDHVFLLG